MKVWTGICFVLLLFSCSSQQKAQTQPDQLNIRYMNLGTVFEYVVKRDTEASELKKLRKKLEDDLAGAEEELASSVDKKSSEIKISGIRKNLMSVVRSEERVKARIYSQISASVKITARKTGADFILNISDDLLYAKTKYDLTEDIIREISKQEKRSEPVSR